MPSKRSAISAADSWRELARLIGAHSENVAGHLLNALCLLHGRPCHDVRLRCDAILPHFRAVRLLCCVRL